jgi:hypothetical protein
MAPVPDSTPAGRQPAEARGPRWPLVVSVAVILGATLTPSESIIAGPSLCVLCGQGALADALRNVLLFLPLGVALTLRGRSTARASLVAGGLSILVETAQFAVPGRDPSVGDVVFNVLGAALGAGLVRARPVVGPLPGQVAGRLGLAAALAATAVFALTGLLAAPELPAPPYYAFWTPELPNLEPYRGRILGVTLGDLVVPPGQPADSEEVRDRLLSGERLRVQLAAGPPVTRLAPLLSVKNTEGTEVLFLGVDRHDLVFRLRTRAETILLDAPELRARGGADRLASAGRVAIELRPARHGQCVEIDGTTACHLRLTLGSAWALVLRYLSVYDFSSRQHAVRGVSTRIVEKCRQHGVSTPGSGRDAIPWGSAPSQGRCSTRRQRTRAGSQPSSVPEHARGTPVPSPPGARHGLRPRCRRPSRGIRRAPAPHRPSRPDRVVRAVSANFTILQRAMRGDAAWEGRQLPLGAEPSVMPINVLAATDLSSFLTPTPDAHRWFGGASQVVETEMVRIEHLDDLVDACTGARATSRFFLKLDTQGFDQVVLRGATRALERVVGLQTEVAVRPLYHSVPLFPDNVRDLLALGFELTGLFGVSHEPDWVAQIEFDCVMRRPGARPGAG